MSSESDMEPASWWTELERKVFKATLRITGPHRDWRGREYMLYCSPGNGNIYGESFYWREYASASKGAI